MLCNDSNCDVMPKAIFIQQSAPMSLERLSRRDVELSCFLACRDLVNQLRGLKRALVDQDISREELLARARPLLEQLAQRVAETEQFDIVMPVFGEGQFSPYFWRWFNWWEDHFQGLTPRHSARVARLRLRRRSAVKNQAPGDDWSTWRDTPAF